MARMARILDALKNGARVLAILYLFPLVMGTLGLTFLGVVALIAKVLSGLGADAAILASDSTVPPR